MKSSGICHSSTLFATGRLSTPRWAPQTIFHIIAPGEGPNNTKRATSKRNEPPHPARTTTSSQQEENHLAYQHRGPDDNYQGVRWHLFYPLQGGGHSTHKKQLARELHTNKLLIKCKTAIDDTLIAQILYTTDHRVQLYLSYREQMTLTK